MNNKVIAGIVIVILILIIGVLAVNRMTGISSSVMPTVAKEESSQPTESSTTGASVANEVTVTVTATGFMPQTTTITRGNRVVWMNKSGKVADVSSAMHPTHLLYPPLNLGNFADGESVSLVFAENGTYKYHNHLEPSKFGTIIVE